LREAVGEWEPSKTCFPAGLDKTLDAIRAAGMIPGLWIESEVVGVHRSVPKQLPPARSIFFQRNSNLVKEMGRYQLDYRHLAVIARMDSVIDRLVGLRSSTSNSTTTSTSHRALTSRTTPRNLQLLFQHQQKQ
jgi:hypothetical protein